MYFEIFTKTRTFVCSCCMYPIFPPIPNFPRLLRHLMREPCIISRITTVRFDVTHYHTFRNIYRMRITLPAATAGVAALLFFSRGYSAECSQRRVTMDVTSTVDVPNVARELNCTGAGVFVVTWHNNVQISSRIDVNDGKHLMVTGASANASLEGSTYPDDTIDAGNTTGIFSVSNRSMLSLRHLTVTGGMSDEGGAVTATSNSIVNAADCVFARNNASSGGKRKRVVAQPIIF